MKILFFSNHEVTIYYFRCELIQRLISDGNEVYVCQPVGEHEEYFRSLGCRLIDSSITQYGMNPIKELAIIGEYRKAIKEIKPDIVLTFTIKPNIYGGVAASLEKTPYISAVTGIGGAFERGALFKAVTVMMYRAASCKASKMFFENSSNSELFERYKIAKNKHVVVNGSGVNLEKHRFTEYPADNGATAFLFIGRVMNDKGCRELFKAFEKVKTEFPDVTLDVVGWCEDECREALDKAVSDSGVTYHGWQEDVRPFIGKCSALVLPSYHEGMANVLLEALAAGRPVLASNIPGCAEAFEENVCGWGFEPRCAESLASAMEAFVRLPYEEKKRAGEAGRLRMAQKFDRNNVVSVYVENIYKICGKN